MANLRLWKPGKSANPEGRPAAGATIREWLNVMQEWSQEQLTAVMQDESAPVAKRAAARCWIDASLQGYTSSGAPVAGSDFDRICDRTEGKPKEQPSGPGTIGETGIDYSLLTPKEVAAVAELLARAAGRCRDN